MRNERTSGIPSWTDIFPASAADFGVPGRHVSAAAQPDTWERHGKRNHRHGRDYQARYATPLRVAIVTPDIVLLAVALSVILGIGAGFLAALRLVRTPPLELIGR